jgi:hypothetical protein
MVEAQHKAKWPPPGQATEREHEPDWSPQSILHKPNMNTLKGTGTCKPEPEDKLAVLKSATPGNLEVKMSYTEGESPRKTPADPQRPHFEVTALRLWASSPTEKEDILQNQNQATLAVAIHICFELGGMNIAIITINGGDKASRQRDTCKLHITVTRVMCMPCLDTHTQHTQGSLPHSSECTHQYTKHLPAVPDCARNEGECWN